MVWDELFIAFIISFVLSIIFLVTWAIGGWIAPVGPSLNGILWISFLIVGVIAALILAPAIPPRLQRPRNMEEAKQQAEAASETRAMLGAFFWMLFIALNIIPIRRYNYY